MSNKRKGSVSKDRENSKEAIEVWVCEVCQKEFREKSSRILECERCEVHHCAKCLKIEDELYDKIMQRKDFHWYCDGCESKVMQSIQLEKEIEKKLVDYMGKVDYKMKTLEGNIYKKLAEVEEKMNEKLKDHVTNIHDMGTKCETKMNEMEGIVNEVRSVREKIQTHQLEFAKLKNAVEEIDYSFKKLVDERLERVVEKHTVAFSDVVRQQLEEELIKNVDATVKKEVNVSMEQVSDNIEAVQATIQETKAQAAEQRDKESRRNNIVLYKVPEGDATRNEERNKQDVAFCLQLFNNCMQLGIAEEDFVRVFRLGRRPETGAPRPLMVQLASYSFKNLIMESLFKLKHAEQKFRGVVISHDMTKSEREECRKLVADARTMATEDTSGEYLYRVRGPPGDMKIVKFRTQN